MPGATRTTADAVLKEDYQPAVREQLNNDIVLLSLAEKNSHDIEGRRAILSLHVTRNAGIGARAEGGTLPSAGQQGWAEERVPVFYNYGRGQISGPLIKSMASNKGSFVRAVDSETKRITDDLKRDVNRQCWGTADGVIAATGLTTNSTVVNLASTASAVQGRQLEVGTVVDIGTVAAPTQASSANAVVSVNLTTTTAQTVTLTTAVTTGATHRLFRSGNGGSGANQKEISGAAAIVDSTGTIFNVDPNTYPVWSSVEMANGGTNRPIAENLMSQCVMQIQIAGGLWPNVGFASDGVFRAFGALLTSLKRFNDTTNLKGGYAALDFTASGPTIPIRWERDTPSNSLYFFNTEHLTEFQMSDWEFMEEDGAVLSRVANVDAYEFVLFKYHELTTDKRNSHGKLLDITES